MKSDILSFRTVSSNTRSKLYYVVWLQTQYKYSKHIYIKLSIHREWCVLLNCTQFWSDTNPYKYDEKFCKISVGAVKSSMSSLWQEISGNWPPCPAWPHQLFWRPALGGKPGLYNMFWENTLFVEGSHFWMTHLFFGVCYRSDFLKEFPTPNICFSCLETIVLKSTPLFKSTVFTKLNINLNFGRFTISQWKGFMLIYDFLKNVR